MAQESIEELVRVKSPIWSVSISYYVFYYSLTAVLARIGIKSEIHKCTLEVMKNLDFYDEDDLMQIKNAFNARQDLQYYANRPVDDKVIEDVRLYCKDFFLKTQDILFNLTNQDVLRLRDFITTLK